MWFAALICYYVCVCLCWCDTDAIDWLLGNAEQLPVTDESYDVYTVAFGIRNMTHIRAVSRLYNIIIYLLH